MSAKDCESYAEILKAMKAKADAHTSGAEVLSIRRTRRDKESRLHKWSGNSSSYQDASRSAGILVFSPDSGIGDFLETEAGFVWVKVAGVCV